MPALAGLVTLVVVAVASLASWLPAGGLRRWTRWSRYARIELGSESIFIIRAPGQHCWHHPGVNVPVFRRSPLALAIVLIACSEPTQSCDVCLYSAIVYGRVSNAAGSPVVGASVQAGIGTRPCASEAPAFERLGTTDPAGQYRGQVLSPVPSPSCLKLGILREGGIIAGGEASDVRFNPSRPYDSVRVDLQVP
jgi:hypothetical protein